MIALENHLPRLRVPWVPIGRWPTPLTALDISELVGGIARCETEAGPRGPRGSERSAADGGVEGGAPPEGAPPEIDRSATGGGDPDRSAGTKASARHGNDRGDPDGSAGGARVGAPRGIHGGQVWIKHEGDAHPEYGGNKVRTLEVWLGHARAIGARRIWAIGAYGSNHAVATVLHAPLAGIEGAAIVFPQPISAWAVENCRALIASGCPLVRLRSVIGVPLAAWRVARRERDAVVMPPGGATTIGTFGALAAAFELADQIAGGGAPPPRRIVLAVGSTCTTAGLVAGLELARAIGLWRWPVPIVHGVRVTPWPVTSRLRTAELARRTLARVEQLGGPPVEIGLTELLGRLVIDGRELGPGYGRSTPQCAAAMRVLHGPGCPRLDAVYSGKAAAAVLRLHRAGTGPLVFWASKSSATLAQPADGALRNAPPAIARWLRRAEVW